MTTLYMTTTAGSLGNKEKPVLALSLPFGKWHPREITQGRTFTQNDAATFRQRR